MMKTMLFSAGLLLACSVAFGQHDRYWNRCGDVFRSEAYPADTFSVKRQEYDFQGDRVVFTVLRQHVLNEDQVWVETFRNGNRINGKYLGGIGNESGVAVPHEQPFPNHFLFYDAGEFTGTFYLISPDGFWFQLPGGELFIDATRTRLYTRPPDECGKCRVSAFNLKTEETITRWSEGPTAPWPEYAGQTFVSWWIQDEEWVQW